MATKTGGQKNKGFASMTPQKQREIARRGGQAAHQKGKAHTFSTAEARDAGRKGGQRVSTDKSHMAEIGRLGGKKSAMQRAAKSGKDGNGGLPGKDA